MSGPEGRCSFLKPGAATKRRDPLCEPCAVRNVDPDAAERGRAVGSLESAFGYFREKPVERLLLVHAERGIIVAAHAGVADVGRAAVKDLVVGGWLMRVRADHEADATVEEMAEAHLFRGRLG